MGKNMLFVLQIPKICDVQVNENMRLNKMVKRRHKHKAIRVLAPHFHRQVQVLLQRHQLQIYVSFAEYYR